MDSHTEPQGIAQRERRQHPHLRAIYPDARGRIDHFFHNTHEWAGSPIDYLAHRLIHEAYPQLTTADVRVLVGAIERKHQEEGGTTLIKGFALSPG
ncbi:MAG: hypothetical protein HZB71_03355 [Betaproteobacteria bacterium]|nr:hypothetical protein [Betaproteobacteria bacterium]